ncbi:MAG: ribosome maturation factor RimM [Raoultibacter sp.]
MRAAAGLPFLLEPAMEVAFVPPVTDMPRRGRVLSIDDLGSDVYLVSFDTVDTIDISEALAGCSCLVRRSDLPEGFEELSVHPLIGFEVEDRAAGYVGAVIDVIDNKAQSLLVIDAGGHEVLIPLVDAIVVDIDEEASRITTVAPDGLLEDSISS